MRKILMDCLCILVTSIFAVASGYSQSERYYDHSFYCQAFETERWYRIYLPRGYEQNPDKRYPVIYYFHGYGGRYKWDGYDLEDDVNYPANGRKEPPFVMEWSDYVQNNDVIIVTWDGYEPLLRPGKNFREGIQYGGARPYDYGAPYDENLKLRGWDYRPYFEELVSEVDEKFRTIADRNHRAITGLSMGGQTAYYIAGQSKDLVSSVSAFDPADNVALYGPDDSRAAFPVLESYRALVGLDVRLTLTDGDWLKYNTWKMKQIFEASPVSHFEFHLADYPNHFVADASEQLDFHMQVFEKQKMIPHRWSHYCVGYPTFSVLGYEVASDRSQPAITLLDHYSQHALKIVSRKFIPDGPVVSDESISITTGKAYQPGAAYDIQTINLTSGAKKQENIPASEEGQLSLRLDGGGHLIGIQDSDNRQPEIVLFSADNRDYYSFETGKKYGLNLKGINLGNAEGHNITLRTFSTYPHLHFEHSLHEIDRVPSMEEFNLADHIEFYLSEDPDSTYMSSIDIEISMDGIPRDTHRIMFFPIPVSPQIALEDVLILDGREVENVAIYQQGPNVIESKTIGGGRGNGNGVFEKGEDVLVYVRLDKGMGPNDIGTYHRTYLISALDDPFVDVNELDYKVKSRQAGATSIASLISLSAETPSQHEINLWLKIESLYNDGNDPVSNAVIYAHKYDYGRLMMPVK